MASLVVSDLEGDGEVQLAHVYPRENLPIDSDNLMTAEEVEQWPHFKGLRIYHAGVEEVTLLIGHNNTWLILIGVYREENIRLLLPYCATWTMCNNEIRALPKG